jgi:hypothetical protein
MKTKSIFTGFMALSLLGQHCAFAQSKVDRPAQFVAFAFDGSYTNGVWQQSRQFSQDQGDLHFTYFINPVYLLTKATRSNYQAPGGNKGSAIGWGDSAEDIANRLDNINAAYKEGHEIASHAVGHWNGSNWSQEDWNSEFTQFDYIVNNVTAINGIKKSKDLNPNMLQDIIGFRAPQLGSSSSLFPTLQKFGFKYDTSRVNQENYWPRQDQYGLWNFPLAQIKEPGAARTWLSMDYNFCVRDTARIVSEDPSVLKIKGNTKECLKRVSELQKAKVKENMLTLYRSYFNKNYYGNRAPIHIGHHFSNWMSGAYMEAFYEFAAEVCSKPEVQCGTYTDLKNFMVSKSSAEIAAYQEGQFQKMARPKSLQLARHLDLTIKAAADAEKIQISLLGRDANRKGLTTKITVNGQALAAGKQAKLIDIRGLSIAGETVPVRFAVFDRLGKEINTATYQVKDIGTVTEKVQLENIEEKWLEGHLDEADKDDTDVTHGH